MHTHTQTHAEKLSFWHIGHLKHPVNITTPFTFTITLPYWQHMMVYCPWCIKTHIKNTHTQSVNRLAYLYAHAYKKKLPLAHWSQKTFNKYYNTTALLCETRFACFPVRGAECHADGPVCTPSQPVGVYQGTKKDQWWWQGHTHPHVAHAAQYLNCLVHTEPRTFLQTMQTEPKSKYGRKWCSFLAPACWIKI